MKLGEHIKKLKDLTYSSFNNQFSRLGVRAKVLTEKEKISSEFHSEREKLDQILQKLVKKYLMSLPLLFLIV